jgi:hypothetical protein
MISLGGPFYILGKMIDEHGMHTVIEPLWQTEWPQGSEKQKEEK